MTGLLTDGSLGLFEIQKRGGLTIIQDPHEAEAPDMPLVEADYVVLLTEVPGALKASVKARQGTKVSFE